MAMSKVVLYFTGWQKLASSPVAGSSTCDHVIALISSVSATFIQLDPKATLELKTNPIQQTKTPSKMKVAPHYSLFTLFTRLTLLTLFTLFTLFTLITLLTLFTLLNVIEHFGTLMNTIEHY